MASIYKRSRDRRRKNATYWIEYLDADGQRRVAKGFTDKGLTEQLASKLENEALLRKRGIIDPLVEHILARKQEPIAESLDAFELSMENNTGKHQSLTMTRVRRLVDACGFRTIGELDGEKVEVALKAIRRAEDLGARTYNHYLQAIDAFAKWLVASKRLPSNLLVGMERLNSETDIRHKRRALTPEEVSLLVDSARSSGCDVQGYDGELRARVYVMSFLTGLRRQELGSLTPRSFKLDAAQPTLTVRAACSKHRREDTLPMHPELIVMVRGWIAGMDADELLFPRLERKKTWLMVKKDLERIGIPYETPDGVADFHAAGRHSYVTGLLRNGATFTEARELARHADVRMTMKYTHIGLEDQAEALAGLPAPNTCRNADWLGIGWKNGGTGGHSGSPDDTGPGPDGVPNNEQSPAAAGLASSLVTNCHQQTVYGKVEAAGIAPALLYITLG